MAGQTRICLKALLLSSCLITPGAAIAQANQNTPDQEQASETAAEGTAKALGQPAVPTSLELSPEGPQSLSDIVVTGQIAYRNRTETVAPELTYDLEFFQKFEPTSVGDSLKRVPGVAFGSDIGERPADPRRRQRPHRLRRSHSCGDR
jgi:outer membrane receptor for ferrienterochelin and colicins